MTEIILSLTLIAFFIYHGWYVWENHKQAKMLTKAILSKDLHDFTSSEIAENHSKKKQFKPNLDPIEVSQLDDEQFSKLIKKQVNG